MQINESIQLFKQKLNSSFSPDEISGLMPYMTEYVFGKTRFEISQHKHQLLTAVEDEKFHHFVGALLSGKPVQHVLGYSYFLDLKLYVNKQVLIPRSETEELVMELKNIPASNFPSPNILDVGTGSGCIAIAIKKMRPESEVWALDVSKTALDVAKRNAKANHAEVKFLQEDIFHPSIAFKKMKFDIIVSNPPYIPETEKNVMPASVLEHEPALALFVPNQHPLMFYERLLEISGNQLNPDGYLMSEVNEFRCQEIKELMENNQQWNYQILNDLQNKPRILKAWRPS